jgi:hypothetical protein
MGSDPFKKTQTTTEKAVSLGIPREHLGSSSGTPREKRCTKSLGVPRETERFLEEFAIRKQGVR